jgi:uncharacterized protein
MKDFIRVAIISLLFVNACSSKNMTGMDIELFKGQAWNLARAVYNEDTLRIAEILAKGNIPVDFKEPKFGNTLLMWAVRTNRCNSVKTLLENGADPNLQNNYDGTSALMYASTFGLDYSRDTRILQLLLQHGGNPNIEQGGPRQEGSISRKTPLLMAAGCCYDKVKLLVEAGAKIDYKSEFNESVLSTSIIGGADEKSHILYFLIFEMGADFCKPFFISSTGKEFYVLDELKKWDYPEGSDEYDKQIKLVNYIENNQHECSDSSAN